LLKYTTKVKQAQLVGTIRIDPKGGDLTDAQVKQIKADPWGKELIRKGVLSIEGVKPEDIKDEPKKGARTKPEGIPDEFKKDDAHK
jgi:hypothetical protein